MIYMRAGEKMLDSDYQMHYYEWILQQLRKMKNETDNQIFYIRGDQHQESLVGGNNLDSDWIEG